MLGDKAFAGLDLHDYARVNHEVGSINPDLCASERDLERNLSLDVDTCPSEQQAE